MSGYAKRFLNQFGWTMAMSIMVSMLVAFTLTPTLSARLLKKKPPKTGKPAKGPRHSTAFSTACTWPRSSGRCGIAGWW